MKLIIGLGNPGRKYKNTKHNFGFLVLDELAGKNKWHTSKNTKAEYLKMDINNIGVELFKPQTFMNNSGTAIAYVVKKHNLKPEDIIVIYDDLDLNFGSVRIGIFKSPAGHNGIKSTIEHLGFNNFIRVRLGINNGLTNKIPAEKFVLTKFSRTDKKELKNIIARTIEAINIILKEGVESAANKYN